MSPERELLRAMLERPSPTGQERAVARLLEERFRDAGLEAGCDAAGNFVGSVGSGDVEVALLGHIDTVAGVVPVEERDGTLRGRGAVDAKGPMAAFASAALRLAGAEGFGIVQRVPDAAPASRPTGAPEVVGVVSRVRPRGGGHAGPEGGHASPSLRRVRLLVLGAVGEEGDSRGARYLASGHSPHYLVIGEPSGWDGLVLGYKGSLRLRYALERPARHSAGPDEAVAEVGIAFWTRLRAWCDERNAGAERVFEQISPSLLAINTDGDGLRDRVVMEIGVRLPPGADPEDLTSMFREWAGEARLEVWFGDPAVRSGRTTPLVRAFARALRAQGVERPRFVLKTGTSDWNVVAPQWRCPALSYGPGDSALDHTPDEHIVLEEYDRAVDVLETAILNLDRQIDREKKGLDDR